MYVFMQFDEIVEKFLEDKKLEGRAPGTIEEYRFRLTEFGVFLKENNLNYQDLTSADISVFSSNVSTIFLTLSSYLLNHNFLHIL